MSRHCSYLSSWYWFIRIWFVRFWPCSGQATTCPSSKYLWVKFLLCYGINISSLYSVYMLGRKLSWSRSYVLRYIYILIYSIYVLFVKMVCGEFSFKWELMVFINVNWKTNSSCLIEAICMNINLFYILW